MNVRSRLRRRRCSTRCCLVRQTFWIAYGRLRRGPRSGLPRSRRRRRRLRYDDAPAHRSAVLAPHVGSVRLLWSCGGGRLASFERLAPDVCRLSNACARHARVGTRTEAADRRADRGGPAPWRRSAVFDDRQARAAGTGRPNAAAGPERGRRGRVGSQSVRSVPVEPVAVDPHPIAGTQVGRRRYIERARRSVVKRHDDPIARDRRTAVLLSELIAGDGAA